MLRPRCKPRLALQRRSPRQKLLFRRHARDNSKKARTSHVVSDGSLKWDRSSVCSQPYLEWRTFSNFAALNLQSTL
jgi:hypothetical protein